MPQVRLPRYTVRYFNTDWTCAFPLRGVYADEPALAAVLSTWPEGRAADDYLTLRATIYGQDGEARWDVKTYSYDRDTGTTVLVATDLDGGYDLWFTIAVRKGRTPGEIEYRADLTARYETIAF